MPVNPTMIDKSGNIWVATRRAGILRYNGTNWLNFTQSDGLPSNEIMGIVQDSYGFIWACSRRGGVSKFEQNQWIHFDIEDGLPRQALTSIAADKHGNIWVGSVGGGIWKFNGKNAIILTVDDGLAENVIKKIIADANGDIWVISERDSVSKYSSSAWINYSKPEVFDRNPIINVTPDRKGNMWFGTADGSLIKFNGKIWNIPEGPKYFEISTIASMKFDKENNLWLSACVDNLTNQEIIKFDGSTWTSFFSEIGSFQRLNSFEIDEDGGLWWPANKATDRFIGLIEFDGKQINHLEVDYGLPNGYINDIKFDSCDNVWFSTSQGIAMFDGSSWEYPSNNGDLYSRDELIIKENNNYSYGILDKMISSRCSENWSTQSIIEIPLRFGIWAVKKDKDNFLWMGTGMGLLKHDGEKWSITGNKRILPKNFFWKNTPDQNNIDAYGIDTFKVINNDQVIYEYHIIEDFPEAQIKSIALDSSGNMWFGFFREGLIRYDGTNWTRYKIEEGLAGNDINIITVDFKGDIWIGTNKGISRMSSTDGISYSINNILSVSHIQEMTIDKNGVLWIGTRAGVFKYDGSIFTNILKDNIPEIRDANLIKFDSDNNIWVGTSESVYKIPSKISAK